MTDRLEQKLGELIGMLRPLTKAVEKLEERVNDTREKAASAKTNQDNLKTEFDGFRTRAEGHWSKIYEKIEAVKTSGASKVWDVLKLLLAALIGGGAGAFLGG